MTTSTNHTRLHSVSSGRRLLGALVGAAVLMVACSSSGDSAQEVDDAATETTVTTGVDVDVPPTTEADAAVVDTVAESDESDDARSGSEYLFDQELLHTFELSLSEEDLAFLDSAPAAEEYVEGSLTFEGEEFGAVGIRYKGSVGAWVNCVEGSNVDFANPVLGDLLDNSGAKTCPKLSIKVKVNWDDSDAEFYGVRKLLFHSMNNDPSQMHDRLGYWLYREMGVAAPRATHARLVINGEYAGIYAFVEQIDGRFTRQNFEDGTGNLYKQVWPLDTAGNAQSESALFEGLRTNEDDDPSLELMTSFARDIAAASPDEATSVIERWMDPEAIISQMVVERTIRHDDSPSHWRCPAPQFCLVNNFYWYVDPIEEKAHLIPWDLDLAFAGIRPEGRVALIEVIDDFGEISNDCMPFDIGGFLDQRSAACDPLFAAWAQFGDDYQRILDEFKAGPFSEESVTAQLDAWTAQIAEATAEAAELDDEALSVDDWQAALDDLNESLQYARDN